MAPSVYHTLSPEDQQECRRLAQERFEANRKAGVKNRRIGPQNDAQTDLEGIGGEFAFCRLHGVEPDRTIEPRVGGADTLIGDKQIDCKTTKYERGILIVPVHKTLSGIDYFALMIGEFPSYRFAGFFPAASLPANPRVDLGYGLCYSASQGQLALKL